MKKQRGALMMLLESSTRIFLVLDTGYYPRECEVAFREMYTHKLRSLKPNVFITIKLFHYKVDIDPERHLERRREDFENLHVEVFNRIDRRLYGARHHKLPDQRKFAYFCRLETKDKRYFRANPHFHILMNLRPNDLSKLLEYWPLIEESLNHLLTARRFDPDIECQLHDGNALNYSIKHLLTDLMRLYERNL